MIASSVPEAKLYISAHSAIETQTPKKFSDRAMATPDSSPHRPETARVRRRPSRSAAMPDGTSHSRLTTWNRPSASPAWASEKPRRSRKSTHTASAMRKAARTL